MWGVIARHVDLLGPLLGQGQLREGEGGKELGAGLTLVLSTDGAWRNLYWNRGGIGSRIKTLWWKYLDNFQVLLSLVPDAPRPGWPEGWSWRLASSALPRSGSQRRHSGRSWEESGMTWGQDCHQRSSAEALSHERWRRLATETVAGDWSIQDLSLAPETRLQCPRSILCDWFQIDRN